MDDVTIIQVPSLNEKQALERVISFAQRFGPLHADLATHAAFPLVLTPDLLYRIWATFLPQIPWTTVSDILLSQLCREVGYEMYEMDLSIRNILLRDLKEDTRYGEHRLRKLAEFLEEYIELNLRSNDPDQQDLAEAQHLTALAYTAPDEAARQIAAKIAHPSQLAGFDLLRVATLTETLAQQLTEYSRLVSYARGVERLSNGDWKTASDLLDRVFEKKQDIEIAGVQMHRPTRAPEPIKAPAIEQTAPPTDQETRSSGSPTIYISYRRTNSKVSVDRLKDWLASVFGESRVRDIDTVPVGMDFNNALAREIQSCRVMLVIIDPQWVDITDMQGSQRLFAPDDLTRIEVEMGLRNPDITVIPVIFENATLPLREALPESLHGLLDRKAINLRNEPDYQIDMGRLIQSIRHLIIPIEGEIEPFEPETIYIPKGPFLMGNAPGEGIPSHETPQHEVFLSAYHIGKYPVTYAQYAVFIRETGTRVAHPMDWDAQRVREGKENHPVTGVTWYEALAYCQWLSQKTGRQYTLPNEAQWEKACRGVRNYTYPWGDEFDPLRCNARQSDVAPVDKYPPQSDFGCFDLVGNVPQWTASLWGEAEDIPNPEYSYPWKDDQRNDLSSNSEIRRVVRGSWFQNPISQARSSARRGHLPSYECGFRIAIIESPTEDSPDTIIGAQVEGNINIDSSIGNNVQTSTSNKVSRRTVNPVVPQPPQHFIGRTEELERVRGIIRSKEAVVITGIYGIGKSTLLRQAANSEEARTLKDGIIWVDGRDGDGKPRALEDLIQQVFDALYQSNPPLKLSLETAHTYLSPIQALVILDGLELSNEAFNTLADLFPRSAMLVSATQPPSGNQFLSLQLDPLPVDVAVQMFRALASPTYKVSDVSIITSICKLLGSVPLAIVLTTNIMREIETSLERVRDVLESTKPKSREDNVAGLERARELVLILREQKRDPLRERLSIAASKWERLGREPSVLWERNLLEQLSAYNNLTDLENSFLKASRRADQDRIEKEKAEAERQAKNQADSTQTRRAYSSGSVGSAMLLDGAIVHFQSLGRGKPVIFLHSWVGSWLYWINSMQIASSSFRSYALDLWGFGDTAHNVLGYSLEQQAALLDHFLNELGIGKVALIGHGLGALVAMKFASNPQNVGRVDRIMAVSCPLAYEAVNPRLKVDNPSLHDLTDWLSSRTPEANTALSDSLKTDPKAISASMIGLQTESPYYALRNLADPIPCLLVYGDKDQAIYPPIDSTGLTSMTYSVFFERSAHFPMIDERNRFEQLLMKFLRLSSGQSPSEIRL